MPSLPPSSASPVQSSASPVQSSAGPVQSSAPSFEQQLTELEKVVEQLERGDLSLEDSVALFERGMHLSEACKGELASAEGRIQVLLQPSLRGPVRADDLDLEEDASEDDSE